MNGPIRVVAVDDEPLALELICDFLEKAPGIELVGRCGDGRRATELIRRLRPDIAFLDIEMPEQGGLEVAKAFASTQAPVWVFVTAFSQHAARAFEVEALDYIVKPFSDRRFSAVLERAMRRVREKQLGLLAGQMASLNQQIHDPPTAPATIDATGGGEGTLQRVAVTCQGRSRLIDVHDIQWIESCDYYARLHTAAGSHLVRTSLAAFEEQLDPRWFARIHRSAIVSLREVQEIHRLLKGSRRVVLRDGTELPVSRSRSRHLEALLQLRRGKA